MLPSQLMVFLEYAVSLIFLRCVSGSYIFVHHMLFVLQQGNARMLWIGILSQDTGPQAYIRIYDSIPLPAEPSPVFSYNPLPREK